MIPPTTQFLFLNHWDDQFLLEFYFCCFQDLDETGDHQVISGLLSDLESKIEDSEQLLIQLNSDGRLTVFKTPEVGRISPETPKEKLDSIVDDFELLLWHFPNARLYHIPFYAGEIAPSNKWKRTGPPAVAYVLNSVSGGYVVDVDDYPAFLPRTLTLECNLTPEELLHKCFDCEVIKADPQYPYVVKPVSAFRDTLAPQ